MLFSCSRPEAQSRLMVLKGNVGSLPITMHLHKEGHQITGYYYYESKQQPIQLWGTDSGANGNLKLGANERAEQPETFIMTLKASSANGTWQQDDSHSPQTVSLHEINLPSAFTYVQVKDSALLRPAMQGSPVAYFDGGSVWPTGNSDVEQWLKMEIRKQWGDSSGEKATLEQLLNRKKHSFFKDYQETNADVSEEDMQQRGLTFNYSESNNVEIAYFTPELLALQMNVSTYSGGAHGNYAISYTSFDLVHQKVFSLADILQPAGIKTLRKLLESGFRKQFAVKPEESLQSAGLFANKIEPNSNFFVTEKGINFTYNPYEIGPFVMGKIDIYIPFSEMHSYLQPGFAAFLQQ